MTAFSADALDRRSVVDRLRGWAYGVRLRPSTLNAFRGALLERRAPVATGLLNGMARRNGVFEVYFRSGQPLEPARLEFGGGKVRIGVCVNSDPQRQVLLDQHLHSSAHFLAYCAERATGAIDLHLNDGATGPGLAFCTNRDDNILIPDYCFIAYRGYAWLADYFAAHPVAWETREPIAFWRGSSTGFPQRRLDGSRIFVADGSERGDWRSIPRIELCRVCAEHKDLFDVGVTDVVQIDDPDARAEMESKGWIKAFSPPNDLPLNRYHIDIDGNVNAYGGLFFKLLSGSTVLKVASPGGHRQWYYDRLRPYEHFVPVKTDLSDLVERLNWLRANDAEARRIGEAGRSLALSMQYDEEAAKAREAVLAALAV